MKMTTIFTILLFYFSEDIKYSSLWRGAIMVILGIVGSVFASFMYTLIHSKDSKILTRRSECNHCERKLKWFELIPIVSYLCQRGKCNSCKERIPLIYLVCEILLGLLFLVPVLFQLQFNDFLMYYLLIIFLVPIA